VTDIIFNAIKMLESVRGRACLSGSDTEDMGIALAQLKTAARWLIVYEKFMAARDRYLAMGDAQTAWAIRTLFNPLLERFRNGERSEPLFSAMSVASED